MSQPVAGGSGGSRGRLGDGSKKDGCVSRSRLIHVSGGLFLTVWVGGRTFRGGVFNLEGMYLPFEGGADFI